MRSWIFAVLLGLAAALAARASDAYDSLRGMAASAAADRGPEAGEIPSDRREDPDPYRGATILDDAPSVEAFLNAPLPLPSRPAPREEAKVPREAGEAVVSAPAPARPRAWASALSRLTPAPDRARAADSLASFDAPVSTSAPRALARFRRFAGPRPAPENR